ILALLRLKSDNKSTSLSPEELRSIVNESGKFIPSAHQEMLLSILDLEGVTVDDIMVPRNDIGGIDIDDDWKAIMRQLNHAAHGRVVLYKGNMDENILGMLRVREAYRLMLDKNEFNKETLIRAADEVYFIPEGTPLNSQLLNFRNNKERIGLVVDEYGDIKGLVTLEDILEEIVGEFTTSTAPSINDEVIPQSDGSLIIEGSANLRDLNKLFDWNLDTEDARTFNGLILEHLEEIPEEGTVCEINGLQITILEVNDNMIKQAKVIKL
ncbi:TPA: CBS domain-containing protein, partial [Pasteurella multocida]|nr:CBS domain-containing protein [Pasteurella multocida]HDR1632068.1 CBS domain-containing protein [Pasteurella multocida]